MMGRLTGLIVGCALALWSADSTSYAAPAEAKVCDLGEVLRTPGEGVSAEDCDEFYVKVGDQRISCGAYDTLSDQMKASWVRVSGEVCGTTEVCQEVMADCAAGQLSADDLDLNSPLASASPSAPAPEPLVHYTFDDTSGNLSPSRGATYAQGKNGKALSLNGNATYAESDTAVVSSYPFSFAAWVNGKGTIVSISAKDSDVGYFSIGFGNNKGQMSFRPDAGMSNTTISGRDVGAGWHHVVGVFASDRDKKLYVDGVLHAVSRVSKKFPGTADRISVGRVGRSRPFGYFNGLIDDVRIYRQALTCEHIKQISGIDVTCPQAPTNPTKPSDPGNPKLPPNPEPPTDSDPPRGIVTVKPDGTGHFRGVAECAAVAVAGDTCLVYPGSYDGSVVLKNSGTASQPITIKAAFPWVKGSTANRTVINGNISTKSGAVIEGLELNGGKISINGSHVKVLGNYIHGNDDVAPYQGVSIQRTSWRKGPYHSNITIKDNRLYMLSHGMGIYCSENCLVENNEIERLFTVPRCRTKASGCGGDVDGVRMFGNGITFRNNKLWGTTLSEVYEHAHVDGIQSFTNGKLGGQGYDTLTNTVIEGNWISDVHQAVWMTTANNSFNGVPMSNYNITFRNNIFDNGNGWGSARSSIGGTYADNVHVYNNTFRQSVRIVATKKAIIKNNLFDCNALLDSDKFDWPKKQYEFTNNILTADGWMNRVTIRKPGIALTNKYVEYKKTLYDPGTGVLKAGSPAIDFGEDLSATGFSEDFGGTARPQGRAWDVGAYEWYNGQP